jgi:DNA-directed RNA polymerase subunit RPC12/RpoP
VKRIGDRAAACPSCGSLAFADAPPLKGPRLRCERCSHDGPRRTFLFWHGGDDRRTRPPVVGNRVLPLIPSDLD